MSAPSRRRKVKPAPKGRVTLDAQKKRIKALQRNYDLYSNGRWHDSAKRDEYIRLAKAVAKAEEKAR